ncbi:MAG: hypothetical protein E7374_02875 [Clostridiales bacterium]|nr:hypothetical protein [Clostridiales bacterium]
MLSHYEFIAKPKKNKRLARGLKAIDDIIDYFSFHNIDTDNAIYVLGSILKVLMDCKRCGVLLLNREQRRKNGNRRSS